MCLFINDTHTINTYQHITCAFLFMLHTLYTHQHITCAYLSMLHQLYTPTYCMCLLIHDTYMYTYTPTQFMYLIIHIAYIVHSSLYFIVITYPCYTHATHNHTACACYYLFMLHTLYTPTYCIYSYLSIIHALYTYANTTEITMCQHTVCSYLSVIHPLYTHIKILYVITYPCYTYCAYILTYCMVLHIHATIIMYTHQYNVVLYVIMYP